jgi:hypothetical protein
MNVKFLPYVAFKSCKTVFASKLKDQRLPQQIELDDFISTHMINDIGNASSTTSHDLIKLTINYRYYELLELAEIIKQASTLSKKFLYISINKFLVYSDVDCECNDPVDYDLKLIMHCYSLISDKFKLIKYNYRSDDSGLLGNYIHPVTTLYLERV